MTTGLLAGPDRQTRGFRWIVRLLIWLVILPTALLLAMAILMLVFWEAQLNILFGVLSITLVGCLVTGCVLSLIILRKEAKLSRLQLDFVSKVSHELRTPLTSIRMFAEMLQTDDERSAEETALCLEVLQKETVRLTERIERLLDWGRMEAGRRVYDRQPERPAELLDAALKAFQTTQVGREHAVAQQVDDGLPSIEADRAAIVDALVNLLSNAVKYSPAESAIRIAVTGDQRGVHFAVSDRGIGIPGREHSRIFQKFYRVNDLLSREIEGSGLGLAIVRHVAAGHGGRVEVASEPGQGSTFTISIPAPRGRLASTGLVAQRAC